MKRAGIMIESEGWTTVMCRTCSLAVHLCGTQTDKRLRVLIAMYQLDLQFGNGVCMYLCVSLALYAGVLICECTYCPVCGCVCEAESRHKHDGCKMLSAPLML